MEKKTVDEFEKEIFDKNKNDNVLYKVDKEIESSVIYDFLSENHGKEKVKDFLEKEGKKILDLLDPEFRNLLVKKILESE